MKNCKKKCIYAIKNSLNKNLSQELDLKICKNIKNKVITCLYYLILQNSQTTICQLLQLNCLSVFDHSVRSSLKGLKAIIIVIFM